MGWENVKSFYLTNQKLIGQEKKNLRNTLVVIFFKIYILSVIFREQGRKMCRNGISYDFSILVNAKYFRNKCRNGISYDFTSKKLLVNKNWKMSFFFKVVSNAETAFVTIFSILRRVIVFVRNAVSALLTTFCRKIAS